MPQITGQQQAAYQRIEAAETEQKTLGAQIREAVIAASRRASRFSMSGNEGGGGEVVDGVDLNELELQLSKILGSEGGGNGQGLDES